MTDDLVTRLRVQADSAYLSAMFDEAADRIEALEAALLKIWELYPFKEEEGNVGLQDMVKRFIEVGDVAHTALREKKDD